MIIRSASGLQKKRSQVACRFSYLEICIGGDCELLLRNFATRVGFALPGSRAGLHTPPLRRILQPGDVKWFARLRHATQMHHLPAPERNMSYSGFVCAVALLSVDVNCEFDRAVCLLAN